MIRTGAVERVTLCRPAWGQVSIKGNSRLSNVPVFWSFSLSCTLVPRVVEFVNRRSSQEKIGIRTDNQRNGGKRII
jgi:hypothetical protein